MRSTWFWILAAAFAGGAAFAQEEAQEESTEYGQEVGEEMQQAGQEAQEEWEQQTQTDEPATWEQEPGMQASASDMSADQLEGMTIVTETGEEIGEIDRVGQRQERVVTVDVGGFMGIAEKTVAIPLSELEVTADGHLQTTLTKEALERRKEFDEQGFTEESSESTDY